MKYKILIFDLDDTLIDNRENVKAAFKRLLDHESAIYTEEAFERWYQIDKQFWIDWQDGLIDLPESFKHETGKKSDEFLDWARSQRVLLYFNSSISPESAIELNDVFMDALTEEIQAIDGAHDTLKYLADKYKIIVATNGPKIATRHKLEKINCEKFVTEILSADMFGYMKPKVEFFEAIEERYKDFNRNDYLIIGDSLKSDVGFGMNAGIDSCWFNKNGGELDGAHRPTMTIKSLGELTAIL
jgi:HAD superfamily hydrolase (TIGR01549 family)